MHKTKLKAAVDRYADLELRPVALLEAIRADEKGYSEEEAGEILEAILAANLPGPETVLNSQHSKVSIGDNDAPAPFKSPVEYIVCDIWKGQWESMEWMINPLTGQRAAIAFNFVKSLKATRKNVKVESHRMTEFNEARYINITGIAIEQLIPVDHAGNWTYKRKIEDGIPR